VARLLAVLVAALLVVPAIARADGDPASDVLVFPGKNYFLPYAPQASAASQARLKAATDAAFKAGFPIKVAVISGPGDLGAIPQLDGMPQQYAQFLGQEIQFGYKDTLLIVMPKGYGISGTNNAAVKASIANLPKPRSNDPTDLTNAAADAVKSVASAAGVTIAVPPVTAASAAPSASQSSGSSNTLIFVVGGIVAVIVLVAGLIVWIRRAPPAPR
jgi:hypothetical protein